MDEMNALKMTSRVSPETNETENYQSGSNFGACSWLLIIISSILLIFTFPISLIGSLRILREYERGVQFRLGRVVGGGARGPGLLLLLPFADSLVRFDLRTVTFDVPVQEIITKDSVSASVNAVIFYRVAEPLKAANCIVDPDSSTRNLAQTLLRNELGVWRLEQILTCREQINCSMQETLDAAADPWGVKVERVELKDVRLPLQLQRAMAAEAQANRHANAKVIAAEGEQKASRALREAADVMSESPAALQLRYLQTLNTISAEKNSTVIFPLPMEIMSFFAKKSSL